MYVYVVLFKDIYMGGSRNGRTSEAGWFISWKIHLFFCMMTRGAPITQETSISFIRNMMFPMIINQ